MLSHATLWWVHLPNVQGDAVPIQRRPFFVIFVLVGERFGLGIWGLPKGRDVWGAPAFYFQHRLREQMETYKRRKSCRSQTSDRSYPGEMTAIKGRGAPRLSLSRRAPYPVGCFSMLFAIVAGQLMISRVDGVRLSVVAYQQIYS